MFLYLKILAKISYVLTSPSWYQQIYINNKDQLVHYQSNLIHDLININKIYELLSCCLFYFRYLSDRLFMFLIYVRYFMYIMVVIILITIRLFFYEIILLFLGIFVEWVRKHWLVGFLCGWIFRLRIEYTI
jgi:hypothetical protein